MTGNQVKPEYNCPDCMMVQRDCGNCKRNAQPYRITYIPVPVYPSYPSYPIQPINPWYGPVVTCASEGGKA